ncbi:FecR family protein [Pontibacter rugosus]|uniref:FecR family protein n=1 Tax=Pontibacter rugosus TaxID=1745966 RepID=A0ABW3SKV3_9BACT
MLREEHYNILIRYWQNQATEQEKLKLQEWLQQSAENNNIQEELEAYFHSVKLDQSTYQPTARGLNLLNQKIDLWQEEQLTSEPQLPRSPQFYTSHWWAVAASLMLLLCAGAFVYLDYSDWQTANKQLAQQTATIIKKENGKGQRSKLFFPDGSVVYLNAESSISYSDAYFVEDRTVYLEGEAFFEVVPDSTKPFKVHTAGITTAVLGTSFNIHAYKSTGTAQVTVATGKVSVQDSTHELQKLRPNQQLTYHLTTGTHTTAEVPASEATAWTKGEMVFRNMPLHQIAEELERWYDVQIEIKDQALHNCRFTATFDNVSLKDALHLLGITTNLTYKQHGRAITLHGTSCK